jgi:hypothetical protein
LQFIIIIPFIIMQQLTMLPLSIVQRFWSMPADTLSSQTQVSFIPPSHSSIFVVQRGMIIMFMPVVPVIGGFMLMPIPGIIICRSIVIIMRIVSRIGWSCFGAQWSTDKQKQLENPSNYLKMRIL